MPTLTKTINTKKIHLKAIKNGVIDHTEVKDDAMQFATIAEAKQFSKDNVSLLTWRVE